MNLKLDFPIDINVNGKVGNLTIHQDKAKVRIDYYNFSEDNEIFYDGYYYYENFGGYSIYQVNIKSTGKKNGNCDFRIWFDITKSIFLQDEDDSGQKKTYGKCEYEGREIKVDVYK